MNVRLLGVQNVCDMAHDKGDGEGSACMTFARRRGG